MPSGTVSNLTLNDRNDFIVRMDDQEMFVMAVLNINAERMNLVLTCEDQDPTLRRW